MTVKEICKTLDSDTDIRLEWNGDTMKINPLNSMLMDAFGDYTVSRIVPGEKYIELGLKMQPVKG